MVWKKIKLLEANQVWSESKADENERGKVGSRELSSSFFVPPPILVSPFFILTTLFFLQVAFKLHYECMGGVEQSLSQNQQQLR